MPEPARTRDEPSGLERFVGFRAAFLEQIYDGQVLRGVERLLCRIAMPTGQTRSADVNVSVDDVELAAQQVEQCSKP